MGRDQNEDSLQDQVVVNDEERYSISPADRENPAGWKDAGQRGSEDECLARLNEIWKDERTSRYHSKHVNR